MKDQDSLGPASKDKWEFWIDRGGTFTDVVARRPDGSIVTHKLLSENPKLYSDAAIQGIRELIGVEADKKIPVDRIEVIKMGTTVATNALLERKGERTLLVINQGFGDALRIAYQTRPKLFDLNIIMPEKLYEQVLEIPGRVTSEGQVHVKLDVAVARKGLESAFESGIRACAIVFMHGFRYPEHERRIANLASEIGFTQVSVSHEVSPLIKLIGRGDTSVVDAYLSPILKHYVDRVSRELGGARLMFMQSNGGLTDAKLFQGKDSILSGPAGGVVGAVNAASIAGIERIIGFDMGGTSTDVTHYAGTFERSFETIIAGVRMRSPMMHIHTIAAGGGSVIKFDGTKYQVGPQSAGSDPGPACYRRGGPLTVTDCNVMLGKIQPEHFPHVFGPNGDLPLDPLVVQEKFSVLAKTIAKSTGDLRSPVDVAQGFLSIAVDNMANAIKQMSVQRGYDITLYALSCFGGAGSQHACLVADALGMNMIHIHPLAGVLSAYGIGLADVRALREHSVEAPLIEGHEQAVRALDVLFADAKSELMSQGIHEHQTQRRMHIKYRGTDTSIMVAEDNVDVIAKTFNDIHFERFGFVMEGKQLDIEMVSVELSGGGYLADGTPEKLKNKGPKNAILSHEQVYMNGDFHKAPLVDRGKLAPEDIVEGPAILIEENTTTIIEPGWQAEINQQEHLILTRANKLPSRVTVGTAVDPVMLEIFNNLFMSIAEQMGKTLENTAYSINIKERLDFSCAVFDSNGHLIANAPHMPVHLGSMGVTVRHVIEKRMKSAKQGDVYIVNDPYNGGTHLPDITVITPMFDSIKRKQVLFYVASRGHHADVGGLTPGSMPPDSKTIEEEGVLFDSFLLVKNGRFLEKPLLDMLQSARYPARNVVQNIGDLKAQIAANEKGLLELRRIVKRYGLKAVQAYMGHVRDNAEEQVRRVLDVLKPGSFSSEMDNGALIKVDVRIDRLKREAEIDFTGTSLQLASNFNAPKAVVRAAVLYVFRTLIKEDIPLNDGCLVPLKITVPENSILNPSYPSAVVAGNVETSQCVTNALYGALGVLAASQGTMNNFTFGNNLYQYYETICGGAGAGPGFDGASAVQTHMTNSRMTDPEILEHRYPILLESFSVRKGSGGRGASCGGDGVIRRIRFLEPLTAAIISNHRDIPPFGLAGGRAGSVGCNWVERVDGVCISLKSSEKIEMKAGDVFVIETPGGGGYGV